eukprot:CAMPEP_0172639552 /NCGR_PEP_ID=MMETSP1068-20121228/218990_1 /TAXON_ID=35684 /ORGANISM="Pseudopedinella elastica, Strain CCMP716" /LENGTH=456 /DNA_ID=CAMNT_0013452731 /DNA_START=148 /DNA_END=1518 /DNA_ORIENTATION=-
MKDPVTTADGNSYERAAIERWFESGRVTSPLTNEMLSSSGVLPNLTLKRAIEEYMRKHGCVRSSVAELDWASDAEASKTLSSPPSTQSTTGLDMACTCLIAEAGLQAYRNTLVQLGARTINDLELFTEDDLRTVIGMNLVECRKLQKSLHAEKTRAAEKAPPALSPTPPPPQRPPSQLLTSSADRPQSAWIHEIAGSEGLIRDYLMNPVPRDARCVECHIVRKKCRTGMHEFSAYIRAPFGEMVFIMSARRVRGLTSLSSSLSYLISMSQDAKSISEDDTQFIGKLLARGTTFCMYEANPTAGGARSPSTLARRKVVGVVVHNLSNTGNMGPRTLEVGLPAFIPSENRARVFEPLGDGVGEDSMHARFLRNDYRNMLVASNKPPRWNETLGAFVLNFNGRVTMASCKNFQLVAPDDPDTVLVQFGRVGKNEFTMDLRWPVTPFQAFAISLSCFEST